MPSLRITLSSAATPSVTAERWSLSAAQPIAAHARVIDPMATQM
jgi:hypothetical protein